MPVAQSTIDARKAAGITAPSQVCSTCGDDKLAVEFRHNWRRPSGLDFNCHDCVGHINRLAKFGITPAQYLDMLEAQGGVCAICEHPEKGVARNGRTKALAVDHDHATGDVRGLLCANCNKGIGNLGDSPERLMSGAAYLIAARGGE